MSQRPDVLDEPAPRAGRVGRPAGPTAQGAASREAIVDAAAGVFARLGYDKARMADIIDASGLSKGSVYFHFDSKETLAVVVLEARQARWLRDVENLLEAAAPGVPRLRRLLPAMLELHRADPDAWVISRLISNLAAVESTRELAAEMTQRWIDLVAGLIEDATTGSEEQGAAILATVLVGAFDGLKITIDVTTRGDRDAAAEALAEGGAILERMLLSTLGLPPS
ncbi:TetR family transcriptional regulator [Microbacterium sp. 22303]|uniref:TetR family transcriptional regulator n=1 Tax=Microbacterium sp. 22303 TaxID=3453905 RepID=UPI003F8289D9